VLRERQASAAALGNRTPEEFDVGELDLT